MIRAQIHDIWKTGSILPTVGSKSSVQVAPKTGAQLPARRLMAGGYIALKLIEINCNLSSKSSPRTYIPSEELQNYRTVISNRFCWFSCRLAVERFQVLSTSPSSQNPLFFSFLPLGFTFLNNIAYLCLVLNLYKRIHMLYILFWLFSFTLSFYTLLMLLNVVVVPSTFITI